MEKIYVNGVALYPTKIANSKATISYADLAVVVGDFILNNNVHDRLDDFEIVNGCDYDEDSGDCIDVYQEFIINERGASFLIDHTDEIVYYSSSANMYLWGITHFGTAWSIVTTEIKID